MNGLTILVNGEARRIEAETSVADLLAAVGAPNEGIAVEVNRAIVRRKDHAGHTLADGDRVEIVGLVGGG